jgi:hypothetical protein
VCFRAVRGSKKKNLTGAGSACTLLTEQELYQEKK